MYHKLSHYKCAANLLEIAKENGVNIKNILYNEKKYKFMNIKSLFALVSEALKHWNILEILINDSNILDNEPGFNIWHIRILITELIFGKKVIEIENKFVNKILEYESKFRELLSRDNVQELMTCKKNVDVKVRYIKVNPIKETIDSLITIFTDEGWQLLPTAASYQEYLDQLRGLEPHSEFFLQDFHIPEVLAFPPGTELHSHKHYKNGSFFFMDKSSCLAPYLLKPHQDSCVLDMCAAPGLKTIHLAGLVQSGKVYAVERDATRFQSLKEMVGLCGADNVVPIHEDVTKLQVDKYADVKYILLDPTCSGSGMRERQPLVMEDTGSTDKERLYRLAGFQLTLLRFALTRFPEVKRVVYSTCSLNVEENEEVVEAALNSKYHNFKVASISKKLSGWINFGSQKFSFGSKCIYSKPESDLTNGFFVAVFKRRKHNISEPVCDPVVNSDDEFSNANPTNNHSKIMFGEIKKDNKFIPSTNVSRNSSNKNVSNYSTNKNASNPLYISNEGISSKSIQSKKRIYDNIVDSEHNFSSPNKFLRKNENVSCNQNITNSGMQKSLDSVSTAMDEKDKSNKQITKSKKKRLRQQKRKSTLVQINNIIKKKRKKEINENLLKNRQIKGNDKIKAENQFHESSNHNKTGLKMSKAQLRHLRTKKLKLKTNLKSNVKAGSPISSTTLKLKEKTPANTSNKRKESFSSPLKDNLWHNDGHGVIVSSISKNIKLSSGKLKNDKTQLITNSNDTEVVLKSKCTKHIIAKEKLHPISKEGGKDEVSTKRKNKKLLFIEDVSTTESINSSNPKLLKEKKRKKILCEY